MLAPSAAVVEPSLLLLSSSAIEISVFGLNELWFASQPTKQTVSTLIVPFSLFAVLSFLAIQCTNGLNWDASSSPVEFCPLLEPNRIEEGPLCSHDVCRCCCYYYCDCRCSSMMALTETPSSLPPPSPPLQ